ncbi:MAG TPA: hypothetical protein VF600_13730 [Abditibacteriaceae bacterium]|jgi:hypothetical protein
MSYLAYSYQKNPAVLIDVSAHFHDILWEVKHDWDIHEVVVTANVNPNDQSRDIAATLNAIDEQFFLIFGPNGNERGRDKRTGLVMVAAYENEQVQFLGTEICATF